MAQLGNIKSVEVFFDTVIDDVQDSNLFEYTRDCQMLDPMRMHAEGSFLQIWDEETNSSTIYPDHTITHVCVEYWGWEDGI